MENEFLIRIVDEYFEDIPRPYANFEYGKYISLRKLKNVRKLYVPFNLEKEKPLLLIDDTVFASAKKGILLTNENLYFRLFSGRNVKGMNIACVPLKEISNLTIKIGKKGSDLIVNGNKVAFTTAFGIGGVNEKEGKIIETLFELLISSLHNNG